MPDVVATYTPTELRVAVQWLRNNPTAIHAREGAQKSETQRLRDMAAHHWRMLAVAAIRESGRGRPSFSDVARLMNCTHTTALEDWERWSALHWRERNGWLQLVEGVADAIRAKPGDDA